ncbi:MAG: hypothetical protein JW810_04765 [Sedimentisphaerales bacterium]|nr:hypothetical protein [Sedimentisphaerales bacterium]
MIWLAGWLVSFWLAGPAGFARDAADPSAAGYGGRQGAAIYVSKQGDNTSGQSWETAFHRIQTALDAIPDAHGGHRVLIRPDTYAEANLHPAFRGQAGSYNLLEGDALGRHGSGATGWVIIDSGAPEVIVRTNPRAPTGNPTFMILNDVNPRAEWGLKSVDWWGPWKCDPNFSGIVWDRWIMRNLYVTGSEGGLGVDLTCRQGEEFTLITEDCVGLGRFAGAAVIAHIHRAAEPVVFRRCYLLCLDTWGDAGGVYIRAHNPRELPGYDAIFEDCTIVGPDNAVQIGYPGFVGYTRVKFKDCRLVVMNFSQPHGTPSTGIIYSDLEGKFLHVDLEDCLLMGYRVFGSSTDAFRYGIQGRVRAYVQYRQSVPAGIERLRFWPAEEFNRIMALRPPAVQDP